MEQQGQKPFAGATLASIMEEVQKNVDNGFVKKVPHPDPEKGLTLYNYTEVCQYTKHWNPITLLCRGIICKCKPNGEIVGRSIPKFFNLGERPEVESEWLSNPNFKVYDKLDGSFIMVSFDSDDVNAIIVSTRGSFTSVQAGHAERLLHSKYAGILDKLNRKWTYWFEVIYPENRIVVSYGDTDDLFLLGAVETVSGREIELEDIPAELTFPRVKCFHALKNFEDIQKIQDPHNEGFVIRWKDSTTGEVFRLKMKFEEYRRLHRLITSCSTVDIWETLSKRNEGEFQKLLERVPDEFYAWVKRVSKELNKAYEAIEGECFELLRKCPPLSEGGRKAQAQFLQSQNNPYINVVFAMLDDSKERVEALIWKAVKPAYSRPFEERGNS